MKPSIYLIGACALAFTAFMGEAALADPAQSSPQVSSDWYTGITGDMTWLRHTSPGGGGDLALGRRFWPTDMGDFRIEGEVGYHDMRGQDGSADSHYFTYMGNLYYDLQSMRNSMPWHLAPYVGAGIGDATVHFGQDDASGRYSETGNAFAYQFMAGLTFQPEWSPPNTEWAIGYRYLGSNDVSGTDNAGMDNTQRIHANNLELTARFHF